MPVLFAFLSCEKMTDEKGAPFAPQPAPMETYMNNLAFAETSQNRLRIRKYDACLNRKH